MLLQEQHALDLLTVEMIDSLWLERLQAAEHAHTQMLFYERQLGRGHAVTLSSLERAEQAVQQAQLDQLPLQRQWELRGGWLRVWRTADGTLHRAPACGGESGILMPALSGDDDLELIVSYPAQVCPECFPGAASHPACVAVRRQRTCPGSRRRASATGGCPACDQPVELTAKRRVRVHPAG